MISKKNVARILVCLTFGAIASLIALAQDEAAPPLIPSVKCEELKKMIDSKAADILVVSPTSTVLWP
jgi:hypothetical protein